MNSLKKTRRLLAAFALAWMLFCGIADHTVFAQTSKPTTEGGAEICENGIDDDGDKLIDGADPDCYTLLAPLPGLSSINTNLGLPNYLNIIFRLAIGIAGVIAVVRIVIYGLEYMLSESIPAKQASKASLTAIIGGLILLIGSVVILNTINPHLTSIDLNISGIEHSVSLEQASVPDPQTAPHNTTGTCPYQMTTEHSVEGVNYTSNDVNIQKNLTELQKQVNALSAKIQAAGGTMTVNSAHRSFAYQSHLHEIKSLNAALKNDNNPDCGGLRAQIQNEIRTHGLQNCDQAEGCTVSKPDLCTSPHITGIGIDLTFSGITRAAADNLASANNIKLRAQANLAIKDPPHWNLVDPPFTGCATE